MTGNRRVGVYFCSFGVNEPEAVDTAAMVAYAKQLPDVVFVRDLGETPRLERAGLSQEFRKHSLTHLVIAGDTPGLLREIFCGAFSAAGASPANIRTASFREFGGFEAGSAEKEKAILACAVRQVPYELAARPAEVAVNPNTLVIGGGIAGIQASLEIANAGYRVYLVEKAPTIGGHMAMFDKTFPTLDCAACILAPKMVEVGQHPKIELMTFSEVEGVSGVPGDYKVRILRKARYVNPAVCTGCGTCAEKCPGRAPSELDARVSMRTSIYMPFPQAVPDKFLIDRESCIYLRNKKCGICKKRCPNGAINFEDQDVEVEVNVGNIIVATGFEPFDAKRMEQFGYGKFPNVLTSLEFERFLNASGPTDGHIAMRSRDKKGNWVFPPDPQTPKSLAILHCIGSRDRHYNRYCSRVCCMYSLKFAHLAREKLPAATVTEYYIDMRAFGKGYEEFYDRIKGEGVRMIRGRSAKIRETDGALVLRSEDIQGGQLLEEKVDMVILSVALVAAPDAGKLAEMLGLSRSSDGWFNELNFHTDSVGTRKGCIVVAGACQGPRDIPDTVAHASAAAARVLGSLATGKAPGSVGDLSVEDVLLRAQSLPA